ncbi:hypothetical protein [Robertmurraya kyonggiensis]|uniref:Uncharacterized protein n=1 Tax=Robertmurraya kyonggiensis TaxID=1037680 RepID=A0A4U1DD81_9BACI|nr:hypothetical protein [Robertmurraya kyonggiensis]TKC19547.1 hypothetical protein FA727_08400 [Robertmurraya kyonggiensis]
MNGNQLAKFFSKSMDGKRMLRAMTKKSGRGKSNWMLVAVSGAVAALAYMFRRNSNGDLMNKAKSALFKPQNGRPSGMNFPVNQQFAAEIAEEFSQAIKDTPKEETNSTSTPSSSKAHTENKEQH